MKNKYILGSLLVFAVCFFLSCKKYFDPPLVFEKEEPQIITKDRKVLLISVDGLAGTLLSKYVPPTMSKLLEHSKYSFESIADANTKDAATWTTILSGKSSSKHGVFSNDFDASEEDDDDIHDHEGSGVSTGYISLYQRLLESGRSLKTLSVTPWEPLDHNLFNLSDENGVVSSDEAAKTKAIDRIKNGDKNLAFAVVNFRDLNTAGVTGGFSMENSDYKTTLDRIDGYVGEIIKAVEQRKNYAGEDWLIIITANHGGEGNSYGGASFVERKVPVIFYNPNFVGKKFDAPELTNGLTIATKGDVKSPTIPAANSGIYDIKNKGEYTIMCKVMNNAKPGGSSHAVILGRTTHAYTGGNGWAFMIEGAGTGKYRFYLADKNASNNQLQVLGAVAGEVGTWETLAVKLYMKEDGKRYGRFYVNGVPGDEKDITTGRGSFEAPTANMFVGSGNVSSVGTFNGTVNNLVFIPKALSDEEIKNFNCLTLVGETVSYWNDITGYWPMNEGSGILFKNRKETVLNTDFNFMGSAFPWSVKSLWTCLSQEEQQEKLKKELLINQYDIAPQIFYWLHIKPADSWGLEGKVFLSDYETEFVGK